MTQQPFPQGQQAPDPWATPAPPGESSYPSVEQLQGRLLFVEPTQLTKDVPDSFNPGKTKDRITADITFLDGAPITHSIDKFGNGTPLPKPLSAGVDTIRGMYVSQTVLVSQIRTAMRDQGGPGMVLGRLVRGEQRGQNNPPWVLANPTPEDADLCRRWYAWRLDQQARGATQGIAPAPVQQQPQQQAPAPVQQAPQQAAQPSAWSAPPAATTSIAPQQQPVPGWSQAAPQQPQQAPPPGIGGPNIDARPPF